MWLGSKYQSYIVIVYRGQCLEKPNFKSHDLLHDRGTPYSKKSEDTCVKLCEYQPWPLRSTNSLLATKRYKQKAQGSLLVQPGIRYALGRTFNTHLKQNIKKIQVRDFMNALPCPEVSIAKTIKQAAAKSE
jgi:hypothetical protein